MKFMLMLRDCGKCQNSNKWGVLNESGTDDAQCRRKVASGRKVVDAIRSLVRARGLQSVLGYCMRNCSCLFLCIVVKQ